MLASIWTRYEHSASPRVRVHRVSPAVSRPRARQPPISNCWQGPRPPPFPPCPGGWGLRESEARSIQTSSLSLQLLSPQFTPECVGGDVCDADRNVCCFGNLGNIGPGNGPNEMRFSLVGQGQVGGVTVDMDLVRQLRHHFDLGHCSRIFGLCTAPHAPHDILHLMPVRGVG